MTVRSAAYHRYLIRERYGVVKRVDYGWVVDKGVVSTLIFLEGPARRVVLSTDEQANVHWSD